MLKKLSLYILCFTIFFGGMNFAHSASSSNEGSAFTTLVSADEGTFNEYRYLITKQFLDLKRSYEVDGTIDEKITNKIFDAGKQGYNYLPDNLVNENLLNNLKIAAQRAVKYPDNESNYTAFVQAIQAYLEDTKIEKVKGKIDAFPKEGNAPLTVTFRGNVNDPTGTKIEDYNYTWYTKQSGKKVIIGKKRSINYTFREEGNFTVFLEVRSSHKNDKGFTDVLSFASTSVIKVKEKVASVIIKVNSDRLRNQDELKFTPEEASFGLVFDATSSTPTSGTKFLRTTWDFGNGIERKYDGPPEIERIKYGKEGEYTVKLTLKTNDLKTVERKFVIAVHDPIATISSSQEDGFLGDTFTLSAKPTGNDKNLSYSWEIIDINSDEIVFRKSGNLFTYSFKNKGKYNIKLKVTEPSGETDIDTKIIYINSRSPVADFNSSIPYLNKPNSILLDGSNSFDPDYSDDGKLEYSWIVDGERVYLEEPNYNGSVGYYTFDSIGDHSVVLEVTDPDNITAQKQRKIEVKSILSVEFFVFPRVTQRDTTMRFVAQSPEARFYEWDFGDGNKEGGKSDKMTHSYEKSGIYSVKLKVVDKDDNSNVFTKNVYVGESDSPYAFINVKNTKSNDIAFRENACDGKSAYIVNRVDAITFSGEESIDVTGKTTGLGFSWKLGVDKFFSTASFTQKFDELGCFPVKLTVDSKEKGTTSTQTVMVKVENEIPKLSSLDVTVVDSETDPVIAKVSALGANDIDGVIQSYLWYYYTDVDPEPQDFRATKTPGTTFVLPKITGNYYFVVVMKDNNEARVNSEELTGSKYFITLAGDNVNTPIVSMNVNDSSISIGEEVIFTAKVENVLTQDISKKVEYSWDIDGDGFYEKKTNVPTLTYEFKTSGEFHSKVKAKYKGFSNTRTVTINVSNVLKPDFDYISVGEDYNFFDTSIGSYETLEWDLGDGTIIKDKKSFSHVFEDKKLSYDVTLKITEGTKVKTKTKKVVKNIKNLIYSRGEGLNIFTYPEIDRDINTINVDSKDQTVYVYLAASNGEVKNYVLDYDIDYDSDLNGGKDDDQDNKLTTSYSHGDSVAIELNDLKSQRIRAYITNDQDEIIDSYDFEIIKNYITQEEIDEDSLVFNGVTQSERLKIEKLKELVSQLPQQHKLKALMFVQKLQEEWFDNTEKTRVILEFEAYIYEIAPLKTDDFINTLESLLIEGQADTSEKNITFNALKNLIPQSISCDVIGEVESVTGNNCYDMLISKLETIRDNSNVEQNKVLGSEMLEVIAIDTSMTNKQKTDFKAILKTFVYGGLENVPEEEKQEEIETPNEDTGSGSIGTIVKTILLWILIFIGIFVGITLAFYIFYRLTNKDPNVGFQDFIIEKTSGQKVVKEEVVIDETDLLNELNADKDLSEKIEKDPLGETTHNKEETKDILGNTTNVSTQDNSNPSSKKDEQVPDWLKGNFDDGSSDTKKEVKNTDINKQRDENKQNKEAEVKKDVTETKKERIEDKTLNNTQGVKEEKVPDWLKGSFDSQESDNKEKEAKKTDITLGDNNQKNREKNKKPMGNTQSQQAKNNSKQGSVVAKSQHTQGVKEEKIPDWLKGGFDSQDNKKQESNSSVKEEKNDTRNNQENNKKVEKSQKSQEKVSEKIDKSPANNSDKQVNKFDEKPVEKENKNSQPKQENNKKTSEGNTDEKKSSGSGRNNRRKKPVEQKSDNNKSNDAQIGEDLDKITAIEEENNVPDWLKGSLPDMPNGDLTGGDTLDKRDKVVEKKTQIPKQTSTKTKKTPTKKQESSIEEVDLKKLDRDDSQVLIKSSKSDEKNKKADDELWDDGMKIPDWLKTDDDK